MTTWAAVEDALFDFIVAASGLAAPRVTMSEQDGLAPAADGQPAITFAIGDTQSQGVDSVETIAVDETAKTVTQQATGTREVMITFRAYSPNQTGDSTARAMLEKLQLQIAFEDKRSAINDAGLGLLDQGDVQSLPRVVNAGWESQAILEWRTCVLQTATQTIPYIAHVNGTGTISDPGGSSESAPIDVDLP